MRIVECVIVSLVFMVGPPSCSSSSIQPQNRSAPVSAALLAEASVERCGETQNNTKVQPLQKRLRGQPGRQTPLDPLSISPVKPKRDRPRRIKPQKKRPAAGSLDQITNIQTGSLPPLRSGDGSSVDQTEKSSTNSQLKPEPTQRSETAERPPSDPIKTRPYKPSSRTGFGLPVDRIGLGRLPSGRR